MLQRALGVLVTAAGSILLGGSVATGGLQLENGGQTVYDAGQGVHWLANANLAGDSAVRAELGVPGIEPNGMMDYPTALKWVAALNAYHKNSGWLGHRDWQLPATAVVDSTCGTRGPNGASFGGLCRGNALGALYYAGLGHTLSENAAPDVGAALGPFRNVKLSYYWTAGRGGGRNGVQVFSFGAGDGDATTTRDSWYYVLPLVKDSVGAHAPCAPGRVVAYTAAPAAGHAVYDCDAGITWATDANLAATLPLGVTGDVWVVERRPYPSPTGNAVRIRTAPIVGGAMLLATAERWVAALDSVDNGRGLARGYLGSARWQLPDSAGDLRVLDRHLDPTPRELASLQAVGTAGPFRNLQPFFYWERCVPQPLDWRLQPAAARACAMGDAPSSIKKAPMDYDFTFGYGIQATDAARLKYFVTAYYPDPSAPRHPGDPTSPVARCVAAGGTWANGRCQ